MSLESIGVPQGAIILDQEEGFQNSLFSLDKFGSPEFSTPHNQTVQVGHVKTGFIIDQIVPPLDTYTISETVDVGGKTERRKLTYDKTATPTHKYYINNALQTSVGHIPDSTKEIILKDYPFIGNVTRKVDNREFFEIRNKVK